MSTSDKGSMSVGRISEKLEREQRRANRARVSQHFPALAGDPEEPAGNPVPEPAVQTSAIVFVEEEDMDDTVVKSANLFEKATARYTGTKEEDMTKFIKDFANLVEEARRRHEAGIRQKLGSLAGTHMTEEQKTKLRKTQPD
ncbi:hypothetical protein CYMTET_30285 [Cymbomonas tetramitiformis]|uniref:Uncharacterized protein n=1 Tax=Cymbomonas tetramitiformis TaxID=36881 RepID=A0AAE0KU26_9CHLO|nr:hypothetical protein CYMTET_30285 [Cymbomonas tetramitiformis]